MGINKVTMNTPEGEQTLIDLTSDSVAPETLAKGATAHNAAGDLIDGKMPTETVLFIPQVLSQEEQAQARDNIGVDPAGTANLKLEEAKTYTDGKIEENKVLTVTQANFSFQEIVDAFNSGRVMQAMRDDGVLCPLVFIADDEGAVFVTTDGVFIHGVIVTTDNQWMEQDKELVNADEYYNKSEIDENHYNKSEIDESLETFENAIGTTLAEDFFNKDTVRELLRLKADANHRHYLSEIDDFNEYMVEHNESATAHQNIRNLIPTKISELTNDKGYLTQHQSLAGYATETYVGNTVSTHNTATTSHNDIRELITGLTTRLNTLANSDDTTLDQMSEVVDYIKNNRTLIEGITTNKVNVSDIINNLTTNVSNKPLSAAQGVALKALIDSITTSKVSVVDIINNLTTNVSNKPLSAAQGVVLKSLVDGLQSGKLDASALTAAINTALAQAKNSGEFDGEPGATGRRGTGLLPITTAPSSYTTAVNGLTPTYRIALSTVKTQASATEVYAGDTIRYSYYHYPVIYVDASYVYCKARVSIRGATGAAGKDYSFDPTVYGLPVLYLTGDTEGMSKDVKKTLDYSCTDAAGNAHTGTCTVKWQGNTSVNYEKKNYSVTFDSAFEARSGWGAQKKYCFKANFIDHTHCRNVVSAKLWGKIRKNRSDLDSKLKALPNAGAIDGFPAVIMLNGEFHGVYTWNIPKDKWMFGMGSGTKEAILMAHEPCDPVRFKAPALVDEEDFEMEFVTDEANSAWVATSVNNLINACINSYGADLDTTIAQYLDWESAIDYYIFTVVIDGRDITSKNYILATYDGTKWFFSAYDLDTTYGLRWAGQQLYRPDDTAGHEATFVNFANSHKLFELIKRFKTDALKARYQALRKTVLHELALAEMFENFAWAIPSPVLVEDVKKYPSIPGSAVNNVDQILRWINHRLVICDKWIEELPEQETPVGPQVTNLVPTSIDTDGSVFNGTGYKDGNRLNSSGQVKEYTTYAATVTGFIKAKPGDVIRMKGIDYVERNNNNKDAGYICFYDDNFSLVDTFNGSGYSAKQVVVDQANSSWITGNDGVITINIAWKSGGSFTYFRISGFGYGKDAIVTVNEEIT